MEMLRLAGARSTTTELIPGPQGAVGAAAKLPSLDSELGETKLARTSQGLPIIIVPIISQKPPARP